MTIIDGVDELVNATGVFTTTSGLFARALSGGVRNFASQVTLTVFGAAAMIASVGATPLSTPHRGSASFIEPEGTSETDQLWKSGLADMQTLIDGMAAGHPPTNTQALSDKASKAVASIQLRRGSVESWAKTLASEVGDIDD